MTGIAIAPPPPKKITETVQKNIVSVANMGDKDILTIVNDPNFNNAEKIDKLQAAIILKRDKLNSLKQDAAQKRAIDFISEANQYITLLKSEIGIEDIEEEDMNVFDVIGYNAKLVALKKSNALVVTGDAGVGKTYEIRKAIAFLNPHKQEEDNETIDIEHKEEIEEEGNVNHVFSSSKTENITIDDIEQEEEEDFDEEDDINSIEEDDSEEDDSDEEEEIEESKTGTILAPPPAKKGKKGKNKPKAISRNHEDSGYYIASGSCTAAALYELLFKHRHKLLIFDDFDSIFKDPDAVNYLKAALDTYTIREVSKMTAGNSFESLGMSDSEMWEEYEMTHKVPNQFRFYGNIIFISNIHEDKFDKALISRALHVEVRLSKEEMIKRMRDLMLDIRPNVPLGWKNEALEHLEFLTSNYICKFDLNLRELIHFIDLRAGYPDDTIVLNGKTIPIWKQLAKRRIVKSKITR